MFRIKRRRTKPLYLPNKTVYPKLNATSLQAKYKNKDNYFEIICQRKGCSKTGCLCGENKQAIDNIETNNIVCCKGAPYRNPILGYRKQRQCCEGQNNQNKNDMQNMQNNNHIKNDVYKDPFAKTCGEKDNVKVCYNKVIKPKQNKNGYANESYNYNTNQLLSRKGVLFEQQRFNFLSKKLVKDQKNTYPSNNNCQYNVSGECEKNTEGFCLSVNNLPCNFQNYKCSAVYKKSNSHFSKQGAVSGGSRINRLKYQTKLKAQGTIIKNKNNLINGDSPGSFYMTGRPLTLQNSLCILNKDRTINGLAQRCNQANVKC